MTSHAATEELDVLELDDQFGGPGDTGFGRGGGEDDEGGRSAPATPSGAYVTGIVLALAAVLVFFLALTSSFIVRKGLSNDWVPVNLPPVLWFNTVVLLLSSFTLERARALLRDGSDSGFQRWWTLSAALGFTFLVGQILAWKQLAAAGVFISTNPSSSFFYLMTGAHGLHLLGGVLALLYVGVRGARHTLRLAPATAARVAAIYWHFMGILWVYLFLLLQLGQ